MSIHVKQAKENDKHSLGTFSMSDIDPPNIPNPLLPRGGLLMCIWCSVLLDKRSEMETFDWSDFGNGDI